MFASGEEMGLSQYQGPRSGHTFAHAVAMGIRGQGQFGRPSKTPRNGRVEIPMLLTIFGVAILESGGLRPVPSWMCQKPLLGRTRGPF